MIATAIAFYLFAAITVAAGFMVIAARNPVHSVLFLILAFFNAAALFVLMGAEFLALILVIVYVECSCMKLTRINYFEHLLAKYFCGLDKRSISYPG